MAIVSSEIIEDAPQRDGRRWITERHIDHVGLDRIIRYLADAGFDAAAAMAARVASLNEQLTQAEISANVRSVLVDGSLAVTTLVHSTGAQNFAALRAAYRSSTRVEAIMIGDFLNTLTDTQLRNAFNLTAAQVTNLRTNKLTPAANAAATIRATVGA